VQAVPDSKSAESDFVLVKSGNTIHRILLRDLIIVEGAGNYMNFVCKDKKISVLMSMKDAIELLSDKGFYRIHKSYLISLSRIETIERHQVKISGKEIPIGSAYRDRFFDDIAKISKRNI